MEDPEKMDAPERIWAAIGRISHNLENLSNNQNSLYLGNPCTNPVHA